MSADPPPSADATFDVIVVGAGAVGTWTAKELTEAGLRVALIEAGPLLERVSKEQNHVNPALFQMRQFWGGQRFQSQCAVYSPSHAHLYVSDRDHPYTTPPKRPFLWLRGRQVGGRLHTWGRLSPRWPDHEFRRSFPQAGGWPIRYNDLAPYYAKVERFWGIFGEPSHGVTSVPDQEIAQNATLTVAAEKFVNAIHARLPQWRGLPAPKILHPRKPIPKPLAVAQQTGRLTLFTNAVVERITTQGSRATAVQILRNRGGRYEREEIRAGWIVLSASTVESVRILLNSRGENAETALGNRTGSLGCYFMDHLHGVAYGHAGDNFPKEAATKTMSLWFLLSDVSFQDRFSIQGMIWDRAWSMLGFCEMEPRRENRITLDPKRRDIFNIPSPHIDVSLSDNDRVVQGQLLSRLVEFAEIGSLRLGPALVSRLPFRWLVQMGSLLRPELRALLQAPPFMKSPGGGIHEVGGARMGDDPATSVVNPNNQLWDCSNVLVVDGACFPSTGILNTTLTMMAIASRACSLVIGGSSKPELENV